MASSDRLQEAFLASASEVLEAMFFVEVLGESTDTGAADPDVVSAELAFRGVPSGRFGVQTPLSTGRLMASNFLGEEEQKITAAEIEQVVCELTNMICGSVLSRIEAEQRFELLHPEIVPPGAAPLASEAIRSSFELEEGAITLWMTIDAAAAPAVSAA
jgi:CheY-specific phosphatase CheX